MHNEPANIWILGASRGLGAALVAEIQADSPGQRLRLVARQLAGCVHTLESVELRSCDLSQPAAVELLSAELMRQPPQRIFFCQGGGPYGAFVSKNWRDHQWAMQVSFLATAQLLHAHMQAFATVKTAKTVKMPSPQAVLIGSSIAEDAADPGASSYCAAKHALHGLYKSLREELLAAETTAFDLRLFSPGYMDTALLPPTAWPRQKTIWSPAQVAKELWAWAKQPSPDSTHWRRPAFPP